MALNLKEIRFDIYRDIIDIDWYENNYRDHFLGHIAHPYFKVWLLFSLWHKKSISIVQLIV